MYKGIIYCRVSTEKQEREGTSLDGQRESCLTKAKELGFEVSDDLIFTESFTGAELIRPELDRVRRLISDGEAQAIFCLDPDRLSRNFTHLMILANEFEKAGCELQFVTQQVGKTPEDRMLFGMKGLFGEYEREKIKERTMRGKQRRIAEGKIVYGCNLFGFDYAEGKRTINEDKAGWVRKMFGWYVEESLTLRQVAIKLTDSGVTTPRGNKNWRNGTVRSILSNTAYIGKMVSEELFNVAQAKFKRNKELSSRNKKHEFLLSGYLYCARCGRRYIGIRKNVAGKAYAYYQCSHNSPVELNRCHNPNQRVVFIDAIIWDRIIESMSQPEKVMEMIEEINNRPERAGVTTELKETDKRLDNLDKEQARLLEEALRGFPDKLVESENKKINDSRARLEERKDELLQGIEQAKQDKIEIDDINKACKVMECMLLHRLGIKDMRKTLELLNIKVYLDGEKLYLTGNLLLPENKPVSEKDLCRLGLPNQY